MSRIALSGINKVYEMQKHIPGKSGLEVSALGLGCIDMSFGFGPPKGR